jgi:hypothetical protein
MEQPQAPMLLPLPPEIRRLRTLDFTLLFPMTEHHNYTLSTSLSSEISDSYDEVVSRDDNMLLCSIRQLNNEVSSKSVIKGENNCTPYSTLHMPQPRIALNSVRRYLTFECDQISPSQSGTLLTFDSFGDDENIEDDNDSDALIDVNGMRPRLDTDTLRLWNASEIIIKDQLIFRNDNPLPYREIISKVPDNKAEIDLSPSRSFFSYTDSENLSRTYSNIGDDHDSVMISHPFSCVDAEMLMTDMSRIKSEGSVAFMPNRPTPMSTQMSPLVAKTSLLLSERQSSIKNASKCFVRSKLELVMGLLVGMLMLFLFKTLTTT